MSDGHRPQPTQDDIERAWRRPEQRPPKAPPSFVQRWHAWNRKAVKIFAILWFAAVALMTAAAGIDVIFDLGWGYKLGDVGTGLLMMVLGAGALALIYSVMEVVDAISRKVHGLKDWRP